jgi:adenosine deaminase
MSLRNYTFKDVVMLMAAKTILQSMLENLGELSKVRTNWTEAYVNELILRVDTAIENFLGLDKQQSLREATDLLNSIMAPALRDLGFVKTQIEVDFAKEAGEMRNIQDSIKTFTALTRKD